MPSVRNPHTEAEARAWMRDTVFPRHSVRLAEVDGEIVGFASRDGTWLMNLYVKPGWTGHGIGTQLLRAMLANAASATPTLRVAHLRAMSRRVLSRKSRLPLGRIRRRITNGNTSPICVRGVRRDGERLRWRGGLQIGFVAARSDAPPACRSPLQIPRSRLLGGTASFDSIRLRYSTIIALDRRLWSNVEEIVRIRRFLAC
jgi:GNAT superfamily N-acetyltransferase